MHSLDLTAQNIDRIGALFPTVVTETLDDEGTVSRAIDFDLLRQELSDHVVEGPHERYQLDWPGKREASFTANAPIARTLRPVREESVDFDTTQNLFIEGDNLEALKLLQESYLGKVKMIYIDPPYNTGGDLIYDDNYAQDTNQFLIRSNQRDGKGNQLVANLESNGRFHSDWLSMMYPRLRLARNLLCQDGVIFVQIDETEVGNLRKLCDQVFGAENFLNLITVKTKMAGVSGSHQGGSLQNNTEYILVYARSRNSFSILKVPAKKQDLMDYIQIMQITGKSWKYTNVLVSAGEARAIGEFVDGSGQVIQVFEHANPVIKSIKAIAVDEFDGDLPRAYSTYCEQIFRTTNAQTSIRQRVIKASEKSVQDLISVEYTPSKGRSAGKRVHMYYRGPSRELFAWLRDVVDRDGDNLVRKEARGTLWDDIDYNNLTKEGDIAFPNGKKPIRIMMDLAAMSCGSDDIVLDFFAGSSSTAHAVIQLNATDGGNRKFIMVQISESFETNTDSFKSGFTTIADLSKERIRRAGKRILEGEVHKDWKRDVGFRVLKIEASNMTDVLRTPDEVKQAQMFEFTDSVKAGRTGGDLLFQVLLDWGLELTMPIEVEEIDGQDVFVVEGDALIACFAEEVSAKVVSAIAERQPLRAVFRDSGFASDADRINAEQIFAERSPATDVKTV
jgi:adenine-specific DNA-methyltransferase